MSQSQLEKDIEELQAHIEHLEMSLYEIGGIAMVAIDKTKDEAARKALLCIKEVVDEATNAISDEE